MTYIVITAGNWIWLARPGHVLAQEWVGHSGRKHSHIGGGGGGAWGAKKLKKQKCTMLNSGLSPTLWVVFLVQKYVFPKQVESWCPWQPFTQYCKESVSVRDLSWENDVLGRALGWRAEGRAGLSAGASRVTLGKLSRSR